ncbi:MAG: hypothetical protein A3D27_02265 [Omnitrophica WOR_2 bacterium RIFCSPHIGHO2_02_FULL_46_37]|nr:MAG: hypothetical protein A3D27_02265 [Omnitrophica WOR_2 bacterium RIFCSPHIGHO2_02_FULL_46_37]OGX44231.1 MAG: hypothetical protein A3H41_03040 [Omnitrophica WOR_2 bacterium RIFCSPLOWO2_02_FULL_45_28]
MSEDKFKELVDKFRPALKRLSAKNRFLGFIDKDDLYQEAVINLWNRFKEGRLENKTSSYIARGCYFHIQNYIRTHKVRNNILSLEEPIAFGEEERFCLKDIIRDENQDTLAQVNRRFIVDDIMNNGLTKREKDVFKLLYTGINLRQIAKKLGISHVRVVKLKQNIRDKYRVKFFDNGVTKA